jgi:hypothetical protein
VVQDLPGDVTHAAAEVRLREGVVADVALFRDEIVAAVVEVVATPGVSDEKARRLRRLGVALSKNPVYRAVAHVCWRCGAEMLACTWPGSGPRSTKRPPEPRPATVEHCVTDGAGNYWANCCSCCSAVQGDAYLERDNPDFALVRELYHDVYG